LRLNRNFELSPRQIVCRSAVKLEDDEDDDDDEVVEVMEEVTDRHMNVNVSSSGQGTRTVVLQIPKDIK
jgi:hypothetical protein